MDATQGGYLLEVLVAFLVGRYGQELASAVFYPVTIFVKDLQCHRQEFHIYRNFCLLPLEGLPQIPVRPSFELVFVEILHIDIMESGKAAEYEHVPYLLKAHGVELFVDDGVQLGLGEVSSASLVKVQVLQFERVSAHPAVVPRHLEYA